MSKGENIFPKGSKILNHFIPWKKSSRNFFFFFLLGRGNRELCGAPSQTLIPEPWITTEKWREKYKVNTSRIVPCEPEMIDMKSRPGVYSLFERLLSQRLSRDLIQDEVVHGKSNTHGTKRKEDKEEKGEKDEIWLVRKKIGLVWSTKDSRGWDPIGNEVNDKRRGNWVAANLWVMHKQTVFQGSQKHKTYM